MQFLFSSHSTIGSIRGENVTKSPSSSLASFCHYALTLDIGAVPANSYFVRDVSVQGWFSERGAILDQPFMTGAAKVSADPLLSIFCNAANVYF
jgi:hypothetical protein